MTVARQPRHLACAVAFAVGGGIVARPCRSRWSAHGRLAMVS